MELCRFWCRSRAIHWIWCWCQDKRFLPALGGLGIACSWALNHMGRWSILRDVLCHIKMEQFLDLVQSTHLQQLLSTNGFSQFIILVCVSMHAFMNLLHEWVLTSALFEVQGSAIACFTSGDMRKPSDLGILAWKQATGYQVSSSSKIIWEMTVQSRTQTIISKLINQIISLVFEP